jgi:hypothetical protein
MGTTPRISTTDQPPSEERGAEPSGENPQTESAADEAAAEAGEASGRSAEPGPEAESADRSSLRAALIGGGAVLAACIGLVLYGVLDTGERGNDAKQHTPAAPVTYEVTGKGTADITYQARSTSGKATVLHSVSLPWRTTVDVPLGQDPTVSIVLGQNGGQARCALAIRGQHIQSATADGAFGRATCTGQLPQKDMSEN